MKLDRSLRARLEKAGQEFLADHFEGLEESRQETLKQEIERLDFEMLAELRAGARLAEPPDTDIAPLPYVAAGDRGADAEIVAKGRHELQAGRVAFALLAGGQASRLRWDGPKGTFPIGPQSKRTLFQVFVEHLLRAGRDHGVTPHLAITTSATTDAAIKAFFEKHDCFGLDRDRIHFACQASLPALDEEGRLILSSPERIFLNPDGHGGAVQALQTQGVLDVWEEAGVRTVCTFQVDNPLLRVVDPDFIGRLWEDGAPLATKVILKQEPKEKLGVVVNQGGRPAIVEYSEISDKQAAQRDADGQLTYRLGSIAVHAFKLDFLKRGLEGKLPLHTALKEIPCVDEKGETVRRRGRKYERFLFDLFPLAESIRVVEVEREREYEPVKNAEGKESPATARAALDREYRRWYREAGREPPAENGEPLEISPLEALGPEDVK